jgi:hypothetical protein
MVTSTWRIVYSRTHRGHSWFYHPWWSFRESTVTTLFLHHHSWYNVLSDTMHLQILTAMVWQLPTKTVLLCSHFYCLTTIRAHDFLHLSHIVFILQRYWCPLHQSSSDSWSSLNLWCHPDTLNLNNICSPYAIWSICRVSDADFLK